MKLLFWLVIVPVFAVLWLRGNAAARRMQGLARGLRERDEELSEARAREAALRELLRRAMNGATITEEMAREGRLWAEIPGAKAEALLQEGQTRFLDVRTPSEIAAGIIPGSRWIPVEQLAGRLSEIERSPRTTIVYCAHGARSAAAAEILTSAGHTNVFSLAGGFAGWKGPRASPAT